MQKALDCLGVVDDDVYPWAVDVVNLYPSIDQCHLLYTVQHALAEYWIQKRHRPDLASFAQALTEIIVRAQFIMANFSTW